MTENPETLTRISSLIQREEIFENETTIFYTYEVDPAYKGIVEEMARAIYQHDKTTKSEFPTGNPEIDAPYLCRADDALRVSLPLLRTKIATEILSS